MLAAGYATRLRPLTDQVAKPLLPLAGRPMLDYLHDRIAEVGAVDELHVVTNSRFAADFRAWAEHGERPLRVVVHDDGTTSNDDRLGAVVDMAFAKAEISAASPPRAPNVSVEDIQRAVCHHFHLRSVDLTSKDRHKSIAFARHVAMYLCKQRLKCSFPEIGRAFGNRDHTTVMSAVRKIEAQRDSDPQVRAHLEALEKKLADE